MGKFWDWFIRGEKVDVNIFEDKQKGIFIWKSTVDNREVIEERKDGKLIRFKTPLFDWKSPQYQIEHKEDI